MTLLDFIGARDKSVTLPSQAQSARDSHSGRPTEDLAPLPPPLPGNPTATKGAPSASPSDNSPHAPSASDAPPVTKAGESQALSPVAEQSDSVTCRKSRSPNNNPRRWSIPRLLRKPISPNPTAEQHDAAASGTSSDQVKKLSNADRQAKQSALIVRSLIVGQDTDEGGLAPTQPRISSAQLKNVKAQLSESKTAGKVIAQLRALPALANSASRASEPIQAVCLPYTDEEADERHFSHLRNVKPTKETRTHRRGSSTIASATIESVTEAFRNLRIVSLFTAPDLGLGQPGDGKGLLAGAVPTAETVINGITQITPQLLALGYATGQAVRPDHKGIYPPTDRMSVLTYWWGLELLLPPPTMAYLSSISNTIMNFLTALGVMYEGVREILPFVRYFSQYIDFEFKAIKAQNHGKGVICAATWIMPAAMVPRPWDFPDPPKNLVTPPLTQPPSQTTPTAPRSSSSGVAPKSPISSPPGTHTAPGNQYS